MDVSSDEKARLFEKIMNQENALGKILHSYQTNTKKPSAYTNTGAMFDPKQKSAPDYLATIQAEYHALRANKTASNSSVISPQRKAS